MRLKSESELRASTASMAPPPISPEYWLLQAEKTRTLAQGMNDAELQQQMLLIARGYTKLAEHAARVRKQKLPVAPSDDVPEE
jgi:hypothetical protein